MPGVVNTTDTFTANQVITSTLMNNIIDQTLFTSDALANSTLALTSGKMKVATSGITSNEMGAGAVTTNAIADGSVTPAKFSTYGPTWGSGTFSLYQQAFEIGTGITSNTVCFVDFHSSFPVIDYDARIIRDSGTNAEFRIEQVGTSPISLQAPGGVRFADAVMPNPSGTAPIYGIRAWVNFNAQSTASIGGTYTRTASTTVTVDTSSDHGLIVGHAVYLDFTVGTGTAPFDGLYVVSSVVDSNTFTVVSSTTTTSTGTISLSRKTIRASGNVANVSAAYSGATIASPPSASQAVDVGFYVVNFTTAMPDANAAISGVCSQSGTLDTSSGNELVCGFIPNEKCAFISTVDVGSTARDCLHTSVQVIR